MGDPSKLTAWERWELASFDTPPVAEVSTAAPVESVSAGIHLPTAEEVEQVLQQARDEGFRKGHEEGYAAAHAEGFQAGLSAGQAQMATEAQPLIQAAARIESSFQALEAQVADELLALAIGLAREVVRAEITAHPETLRQVVRQALTQLPHQHAAIYLHPDDVALVRNSLGESLSHAGHRIHEDFQLQRGDCVIEAGGAQVDASIAMRWQRVLAGLGVTTAWEGPAPPPDSNEP